GPPRLAAVVGPHADLPPTGVAGRRTRLSTPRAARRPRRARAGRAGCGARCGGAGGPAARRPALERPPGTAGLVVGVARAPSARAGRRARRLARGGAPHGGGRGRGRPRSKAARRAAALGVDLRRARWARCPPRRPPRPARRGALHPRLPARGARPSLAADPGPARDTGERALVAAPPRRPGCAPCPRVARGAARAARAG